MLLALYSPAASSSGTENVTVCASVWAPAFSMMECMMAARLSAEVTRKIISRSSEMAMPKNLLVFPAEEG